MRIWLDKNLIDEIYFEDNINEKETSWEPNSFFDTISDNNKKTVRIPEKFFLYRINSAALKTNSKFVLELFDWKSNYNNGFMNKSDTYFLKSVFFAPEKFYFKNRKTFEDFNQQILEKNNFIHDQSDITTKKNEPNSQWRGWPCPQYIGESEENFDREFNYMKGTNCTISLKIFKKFGFFQFFNTWNNSPKDTVITQFLEIVQPDRKKWKDHIDRELENGKKTWPINNQFLSFCYNTKQNKYFYEDQ